MKNSFIKVLPVVVAVMLATSCSKDDGIKDATPVVNPTQIDTETNKQGVPFTIKATVGKKLTKIGYADDGTNVLPSFSDDDVNSLKMTLSPANYPTNDPNFLVTYWELTLINVDGTFSGTLKPEPEAGTELLATICTGGGYNASSTISLTDLMDNCQHKYEGTFTYGSGSNVMLTDQNAYFEIRMSSLQHKLNAKMYDEAISFDVNDDGKVWIVVEAGCSFETNFFSKFAADVKAGEIYTIDRSGLVDLGIPNILWADHNVGATNPWDYGDYFAWGEVNTKTTYTWDTYAYGTENNLTKYTSTDGNTFLKTSDDVAYINDNNHCIPSQTDYATLISSCKCVWTTNYNGTGKSGYIVYKKNNYYSYSVAKDPHIFFPSAGYREGTSATFNSTLQGCYWTSTLYSNNPINARILDFFDNTMPPSFYDIAKRCHGLSVREVRRSN